MTIEEIDEYKKVAGVKGWDGEIRLWGYTSTSLKKDEAEKFTWENKNSGH